MKDYPILKKLSQERVLNIVEGNGVFYLVEQCDEYFSYALTKQDCDELSRLFNEIAESIK